MEESHEEIDSLLSEETPLSQDTHLSLSEETPLVAKDDLKEVENKSRGSAGTLSSNTSVGGYYPDFYDADNELEKPWPATFERSISLLAGPTMDTKFIEQVTKSPKITPNLSARRVSTTVHICDTIENNRFANTFSF